MHTETIFGRESFLLDSDKTAAQVTVNGGHITANFDLGGKRVDPFFLAPWWNEDCRDLMGSCDYALRGIFFCFPFGISQEQKGVKRPCHGFAPARDWEAAAESDEGGRKSLTLTQFVPEENARMEQTLTLQEGETVLYIRNTVSGAHGNYPVGYHPTLQIPEEPGSAMVDMSDYAFCRTAPEHIDQPEKGGYCSLPLDYPVEDETNVPTVYGRRVNLKRQPFIKGFDDIYMYVFDQGREFDYAAVSVPSEGYLYYQLKNPAQLSNTMIWTSYCGRHYPKWYGRVNGCIEIGAGTNYFFYGLSDTLENNPLSKQGYPMYHEFDGSTREYKLIAGVAAIPADYPGVASITKKDEHTLVITDRNGGSMEVACRADFLR